MSKNRRDLTGEERTLWRRVASTLKTRRPLPPGDEPRQANTVVRKSVAHEPPPRVATPHRRQGGEPPQNRVAEKRVRRGDIEIAATLDLHGHSQVSALEALSRFLHRAHKRGDRAVIVVTGVGRGGEGVLKRMFPTWLAAGAIRPLVSGYAPAHRSHGGAGAFYVFIKRPRD